METETLEAAVPVSHSSLEIDEAYQVKGHGQQGHQEVLTAAEGQIRRSKHSESPKICTNNNDSEQEVKKGALDSRLKVSSRVSGLESSACHLQSKILLIPGDPPPRACSYADQDLSKGC